MILYQEIRYIMGWEYDEWRRAECFRDIAKGMSSVRSYWYKDDNPVSVIDRSILIKS